MFFICRFLRFALWLACLSLFNAGASAAEWFVSPQGQATAPATRARPRLWTAMLEQSTTLASPGDTITMLPGLYRGDVRITVHGTADRPLLIVGEGRATIDSHRFRLGREHEHLIWEDLEFTDSQKNVQDADALHVTIDMEPGAVSGGSQFHRCVFHDCRNALQNVFSEITDSLIYYNGRSAREHGIYAQNASGKFKTIRNNIIFHNAGFGLHLYGSDGMSRWIIAENILFENGALLGALQSDLLLGGKAVVDQVWITNNVTYTGRNYSGGNSVVLGYGSQASTLHRQCRFSGNTILGRRPLKFVGRWDGLTITDNLLHAGPFQQLVQRLTYPALEATERHGVTLDHNTYSLEEENPIVQFEIGPNQNRTFIEWKAETGWDSHSTLRNGATIRPPDSIHWSFAKNRKRAHLALYNGSLKPVLQIDASNFLKDGETYELRNAANYYGEPLAAGRFQGSPLTVRISSIQAGEPLGYRLPTPTAPEFIALVLTKTTSR